MNLIIKPTAKQHQVYQALQSKDVVFFGGGAGGGKAQPLYSKILTPNGFVNMGDLKIGDKIISSNNKIESIIRIFPQGEQDIYEITFIDGAKIRTTDEHLFDCWLSGRGQRSRAVRQLKDIIKLKQRVIIPLSDKLEFGNEYKEADCYTIGVLLGDGGLTRSYITLTNEDEEIFDYLDFKGSEIRKKNRITYSVVGEISKGKKFSSILKNLGILPIKCNEKKVPDVIKNGSLNNRLEVLRGLMDTDGTIDIRGHCSFISKSKNLAEDVQYLVRSIGGKATLTEKKKFCYYNGEKKIGLYFEVYINYKDCSELFKLKRKKERAKKFNGGVSELGRRIIKIEKVGRDLAQCIVITGNHLYISNDFIVTHNSWCIAESRLLNAVRCAGYKSFIGREELKRLMQSTYVTWTKVCQYHKIPNDLWKLNGQYNYIEFTNGSRIDLLDLKFLPTDPLYERFGSLEYTDGAIEEAGEVHFLAYDVLKSRINRHKNEEFGIYPSLLVTGNPKKNWTYHEFYKPYKSGTLADNKVFIQSLYSDNPYTSETYGKQLEQIQDKQTKERLKFGNWEYESDDNALMPYDNIVDIFTNTVKEDEKYLIADIARFGRDRTVISLWKGLNCYRRIEYTKQALNVTADNIKQIVKDEQIPYSHILIDEDGVGGGVLDMLSGAKGFTANSSPIEVISKNPDLPRENYRNLKSQCGYKLAEYVNNHLIALTNWTETEKEMIIEEVEQIKKYNPDKENKLQITPKEIVKELIGRSPDYSDNLLMRMYFELVNSSFVNNFYPNIQTQKSKSFI